MALYCMGGGGCFQILYDFSCQERSFICATAGGEIYHRFTVLEDNHMRRAYIAGANNHCVVTHIARAWINRVRRLPILPVVN